MSIQGAGTTRDQVFNESVSRLQGGVDVTSDQGLPSETDGNLDNFISLEVPPGFKMTVLEVKWQVHVLASDVMATNPSEQIICYGELNNESSTPYTMDQMRGQFGEDADAWDSFIVSKHIYFGGSGGPFHGRPVNQNREWGPAEEEPPMEIWSGGDLNVNITCSGRGDSSAITTDFNVSAAMNVTYILDQLD